MLTIPISEGKVKIKWDNEWKTEQNLTQYVYKYFYSFFCTHTYISSPLNDFIQYSFDLLGMCYKYFPTTVNLFFTVYTGPSVRQYWSKACPTLIALPFRAQLEE